MRSVHFALCVAIDLVSSACAGAESNEPAAKRLVALGVTFGDGSSSQILVKEGEEAAVSRDGREVGIRPAVRADGSVLLQVRGDGREESVVASAAGVLVPVLGAGARASARLDQADGAPSLRPAALQSGGGEEVDLKAGDGQCCVSCGGWQVCGSCVFHDCNSCCI